MSSYTQEKEFINSVISTSLLDDAISWIKDNLKPDDVFNAGDLENWAEDNGYIKKFES